MRGDQFKVATCGASTAIWIATCGRPDVADVKKLQRVPSPLRTSLVMGNMVLLYMLVYVQLQRQLKEKEEIIKKCQHDLRNETNLREELELDLQETNAQLERKGLYLSY